MLKLSKIQKDVLTRLVDRYENRSDYGSDQKNPRRTLLKIDSRQYPDYHHISDSSFRLSFNAEMEQLERNGLVGLEWERFNEGEILHRVALVEDSLPEIYNLLERRSKREIYRSAISILEEWRQDAPSELSSFYEQSIVRLKKMEAPPSPLKPEKEKELVHILKGLHAFYEPRKSEIAKRMLSVRLYGDSKRWEALEKSILSLLKKYCLSHEEASLSNEELLSERGIVDNPLHINIAGSLVFSTEKGEVDLSVFYPDLGLSSEMAEDLVIRASNAGAVVTVENKTSYYQYIREGPLENLVLYLGGYHNSPRRKLLQKIYYYFMEQERETPFYHWGDMDLGGINIWYNLKEKTGIPFQPLYMDVETYRKYLHSGYPIDEAYCQKLASLLENPDLAIFHPLIRAMLKEKICIEQEALILG